MSTVCFPFFTITDSIFRSASNGTSSTFSQPVTSIFLNRSMASSRTPRTPVRFLLLKYPHRFVSSLSVPAASTHFIKVMWSSVSVPVLSVQSTSTLPKLWIAANFLTITPFLDISMAPLAKLLVTMSGRSSGVRPTAIATAKMNICNGSRRITKIFNKMTASTKNNVVRKINRLKSFRFFSNSVGASGRFNLSAILPTLV